MIRILKALARVLLAAVVCTFVALYALRPAADMATTNYSSEEWFLAVGVGVLCGIALLWRVLAGNALTEELGKVERAVTSGDHLG